MRSHHGQLRWSAAVAVMAFAVLVPWPSCKPHQSITSAVRVAAGQGLSLTPEVLGAGEAATATQLEYFEDSLSIALTGGRGRGGRGGSGNLGGAAFTDVDRLQQLQRGIQYLAGSHPVFSSCQHNNSKQLGDNRQKPFCNNFVPLQPRDQQSCATCVSQSVATAMQIAVAAALEDDVSNWEINAASLYYCTEGGRSCSTGYDIQENLYDVIDRQPELIRLSSCLSAVPKLTDTVGEPGVLSWRGHCDNAKKLAAECSSTHDKPLLNCTYQSLSTFWEIQRHIRNHGAVISRITIYDDFDVQFGPQARHIEGEKLPPYKFNKTAKILYGHAALIVGYDNENYTWTMLNSWGSGRNQTNPRSKGITADGLFKIQMGVAGVGVPDKTYGVKCAPQPGSSWDPDGVRQFYNYKPKDRMTVDYLNPQRDRNKKNVTCYKYNFKKMDTVASVVDNFNIDMPAFVADQMNLPALQRAPEWGYQNITYKLAGTPPTDELSKVLKSTTQVLNSSSTFLPYIRCWHYDKSGKVSTTRCDITTGAQECTKLGNGTVDCTVYYSAYKVPRQLQNKTTAVRVCKIKFPALAKPVYSQTRALAALNIRERCSAEEKDSTTNVVCDDKQYVTSIWPVQYDNPDYVEPKHFSAAVEIKSFTEEVIHALLTLGRLQAISLDVESGSLPLQLSGLKQLKQLLIRYSCMSGPLPEGWGWRGLKVLVVGAFSRYSPSRPNDYIYRRLSPGCGITGPLPAQWPAQMRNYRVLRLSNNRLTGPLPAEFAASNNAIEMYLNKNNLGGPIPAEYANWGLQDLRLEENQLTGTLPTFDSASGAPSQLQENLKYLNLSYNQLAGELPSSWRRFSQLEQLGLAYNKLQGQAPLTWAYMSYSLMSTLALELNGNTGLMGCLPVLKGPYVSLIHNVSGTKITGLCNNIQSDEVEAQQRKALDLLPQLFTSSQPGWTEQVRTQLGSLATMQDLYGDPASAVTTVRFPANTPNEGLHFDVVLEGVDGAIYVTGLKSWSISCNLTALMQLLPQLPLLRDFNHTHGDPRAPGSRLPPNLHEVAPRSLKTLKIQINNITGTLPSTWSNWTTIEYISISSNPRLIGGLPEWTGMSSLRHLDLSQNSLSGTFPPSYGTAAWSKQLETLDLVAMRQLQGSIPGTWASLHANIRLSGANITGCFPDQLNNRLDFLKGPDNVPCSIAASNKDRDALVTIKSLFSKTGMDFTTWLIEESVNTGGADAPPGPAPYYCRKWQGVSCDAANQVSRLDLSALLEPGVLPRPTDFSDALVALLANMTGLQTLKLSGCNLRGTFLQSLALLSSLKNLDLSNNTGMAGSLPSSWASLVNLETLDVSGCTVTGSIPSAYAALQWLKVFNASGNPGIIGQLPGSFGLLADLQVLDLTNASLTGQLPAAWFDSSARKAQAAALTSSLDDASIAHLPNSSTDSSTDGVGLGVADSGTVTSGDVRGAAATAAGPQALLGMSQLLVLRLSGNQLTGSIPSAINVLSQLQVLDLGRNKLQGTVPEKLAVLLQLQEINLTNNQLQGSLMPAIARLKQLQILDLSQNSFTGVLPDIWVSLANLKQINLASNFLSGDFPLIWGSMSNPATHKLSLVDLRDNPCFDAARLDTTIAGSRIEANGRVQVLRGVIPGSSKTCPAAK